MNRNFYKHATMCLKQIANYICVQYHQPKMKLINYNDLILIDICICTAFKIVLHKYAFLVEVYTTVRSMLNLSYKV